MIGVGVLEMQSEVSHCCAKDGRYHMWLQGEKLGRKGCGDDWKRKQEKGALTTGLPMIGQRLSGGFS